MEEGNEYFRKCRIKMKLKRDIFILYSQVPCAKMRTEQTFLSGNVKIKKSERILRRMREADRRQKNDGAVEFI